jgi:hypothetical protein
MRGGREGGYAPADDQAAGFQREQYLLEELARDLLLHPMSRICIPALPARHGPTRSAP